MLTVRRYLVEAIGWAGAVFSLSAYSLNSLNLIRSQSIEYLVMNMLGCCFLIIYAVSKKAHASWVLNSIWLLMTAVALAKVFFVSKP
ncbi:CBU_0592 family membrane protein [Telluribacter humicola]|uniref:CBU_0592 family membrane protein n=1 Tax=Telluribacter humicola TaxID=1720261 RepID=UPI001A96E77A